MAGVSGREIGLGGGLRLPVDVATEAVAVLGRRGKGKTNTAGVLVEELVGLGVPVCVVDTVGVWWGLRSSKSGKGPGLPVVVFGGSLADVPLEEGAGKVVAQVVVERRIPAVVDTSLFGKAAARRFLTDFVGEVYRRNRDPMHVVFDEADELAPQNPRAEGARLLGAMEDFVRRGRSRGLGVTLVTQRPAVLNKDVLTQVEVLIAHGLTGPRDVAAIDEWVRLHADAEQARQVKGTLAGLPVGRAWVWSPSWLGILQLVDVRARRTFDSSATPKVGVALQAPKARAKVDTAELAAAIADALRQAEPGGPARLRERVAWLERELAARPRQMVEVPVPVPTLGDADRARLESARQALARLEDTLAVVDRDLAAAREVLADLEADRDADTQGRTAPAPAEPAGAGGGRANAGARPAAADPAVAASAAGPVGESSPPLGKAERAILAALATYGPRSHAQVAQLTGYSGKGGGFANALGRLRTLGRVAGGRDRIQITQRGIQDLGDFEALPAGPDLVQHWMGRLGKAERAILSELVEAWPGTLDNEQIAGRAGYAASGGGFANALGRLRTLGLIHGPRTANAASDELGSAAKG